MENNACKYRQDESHAADGGLDIVPLTPIYEEDIEDQQQEGGMNINADSRQSANSPGPTHALPLLSPSTITNQRVCPS
jgi:hypothetical protein